MTWHFLPWCFQCPDWTTLLPPIFTANSPPKRLRDSMTWRHLAAIFRPTGATTKAASSCGQGTQSAMSLMVHVNVQIPNDQNWNGRNGRVHNSREMISNILISAVKQPNIDQRYNVPGLQWWGYLHSRQVLHSNVVARGSGWNRKCMKSHAGSNAVDEKKSDTSHVWKYVHDVQGFKPFTSWSEDRTP